MSRSRSHRPRPRRSGGSPAARSNRHAETGAPVARLSEEELYQEAAETPDALLLILDNVQDPHNLGACLRSADGAGAMAVITPKRHSAPMSDTVIRVACGAASSVPVVSVTNLARCLDRLREEAGVRIIGTADQADGTLYEADLTGPLAIALGAEETGLRRLSQEKCDSLVSIPMAGEVECLNVSNAAAVCLFEAVRQREWHGN